MKPMNALGKGSVAMIVRYGLGVAWLLLWIVAGLTLITAVGYAIAAVMAANGALDGDWLHRMAMHIRLRDGTIENYHGPDWVLVYSTVTLASVGTAGALIIVWRLRKLFDSFLSAEPFRRENAYHLRIIWITMLVMEVLRIAVLIFAGIMIRAFSGPDIVTHARGSLFNIMTWASILILIVLAEVFREGARLKEEQELTI